MSPTNDYINDKSGACRLRYVPKRDVFQVHTENYGAFEGSLKEIWQKMHWDLEIENKEIRYALAEMERNKHNVAEFGIFGSFLFTKKD